LPSPTQLVVPTVILGHLVEHYFDSSECHGGVFSIAIALSTYEGAPTFVRRQPSTFYPKDGSFEIAVLS
jgi:hypothetical protein